MNRLSITGYCKTLLLYLMLLCIAGCKKDPEPTDNGNPGTVVVTAIEITAPTTSIQIGDTLQLKAVTKDATGNVITGKTIAWSISDSTIATLNNGTLIGKSNGKTTVTAKSETISSQLLITVGHVINEPHNNVTITYGSDVPIAAQQKATGFFSAIDSARPVSGTSLSIIKDRNEDLIFALNEEGEALLIALGKGSAIQLDATSTAVAMVRFALNSSGTGAYNGNELNDKIKAASSFVQLRGLVQSQLEGGHSPLNKEDVTASALEVAKEILVSENGLVPNPREESKHYDFINTIWKGENLWFDDVAGSDIKFFNDTRLDWIVTTKVEDKAIDTTTLAWLPFKLQEFITALNPPTETLVKAVDHPSNSGNFTVTVSQEIPTRQKHVLYFFQMLGLTLLEWTFRPGTTHSKRVDCAANFAQAVLKTELPDLLLKQDGKSAMNYINSQLSSKRVDWIYPAISTCTDIMPKVEDMNIKFLSATISVWKKIQFAVAAGTTLGFSYQMQKYWGFSETQSFCKIGGKIGVCGRKLTKISGDGQVVNPGMSPSKPLVFELRDGSGELVPNEEVLFTRSGPDEQRIKFTEYSDEKGRASCNSCYIGEKVGTYSFIAGSPWDNTKALEFVVEGSYIFNLTAPKTENSEGLIVYIDEPPYYYVTPGYAFSATAQSKRASLKDGKFHSPEFSDSVYMSMDVFDGSGKRIDEDSKLTDLTIYYNGIQSYDPFHGRIYLNGYPHKTIDGQAKKGKTFEFVMLYNGYRISNTIKRP